MKFSDPGKYKAEMLYRAAELLLLQRGEGPARLRMKEIAEKLKREYGKRLNISRETLCPLVEEAARRNLVRLVPPVNVALRRELIARFPGLTEQQIEVVETRGPQENDRVPAVAADKALAALDRIAGKKPGGAAVGLGLGPGRATLEFCNCLSAQLKSHPAAFKLCLVAITAGSPATMLENAPASFLNLFPEHLVERKIGLFAETLVRARHFRGLTGHTGVKEAFAAKNNIDVVVTAMGDFADPHDLLSLFLKDSRQDLKALRRQGWLGNVQYRPFTAHGPVRETPGQFRAVTVFELEDLVRLAGDGKREVILMVRQCRSCPRAHAVALRALLRVPSLKVFSRLILDGATATELLRS